MSGARISVSDENITIPVSARTAEAYALAAIDVLTRTFPGKVHFLESGAYPHPRITERAHTSSRLTVFQSSAYPAKKFQSMARVVESEGFLVVVPPGKSRISRVLGASLLRGIQESAPRYLEGAE